MFAEIASKILNGCVTRKDKDNEKYKVVYEVDYMFLEEYGGQEQDNDEKLGTKQSREDAEPSYPEQSHTDSL